MEYIIRTNDLVTMHTSGKTIAKNTVYLYLRMILVMLVSLYSSRVVLDVLGVSDYGLYNVVGGIVSMLAVLNGSISAGTSRFISYELGVGDKEQLRNVFNVALVSHIGIAILVVILAESIGLWFLNTQIVFPEERTVAVNVIYQLSILTIALNFTQMPYTATIIAHEKMSIYAYISIVDVVLRLIMILILINIRKFDALIAYSVMIFIIQLVILCLYRFYCIYNYEESHWRLVKDKRLYRSIISFAGWDIIGSMCVISQGQGINVLMNIYFGPAINAARAIAYQVQGAFQQFTGNFIMAVQPEIVKTFAVNDYKAMIRLINNAALYSYYLLLVFMMPLLFRIDDVLNIWLKEVPDSTSSFSKLVLVYLMIRSIANPVIKGVHATGDIKYLNIVAGGVGLLPLPICWVGFHFGLPSIFAFWIILIFGMIANVIEIIFMKQTLPEFSIKTHLRLVYLRCIFVSLLTVPPCWILNKCLENSFWGFVIYYLCAFMFTVFIVFYTGLTKQLRKEVINKLKHAIQKIV